MHEIAHAGTNGHLDATQKGQIVFKMVHKCFFFFFSSKTEVTLQMTGMSDPS